MPKYTNRQQLISTQTIADIAEQVHNKEIQKLIKRNILFDDYDPLTNLWSSYANPAHQTSIIDWEGKAVQISNLRQTDSATIPTQAVVNDPNLQIDLAAQAIADGVNVIHTQFSSQFGRRTGDQVLVHAVSALIRLRVGRVNSADDQYMDTVKFKYGFYTWTKINNQGYLDNTDLPTVSTLIKWKPQGYSAQLDNQEHAIGHQGNPFATENLAMIMNSEKSKGIATGSTSLKVSSIVGTFNFRTVRIYKEFKDPIPLNYDPTSQSGDLMLNQKIFFAIQSNCPNLVTVQIEPHAQVITKLYYSNRN